MATGSGSDRRARESVKRRTDVSLPSTARASLRTVVLQRSRRSRAARRDARRVDHDDGEHTARRDAHCDAPEQLTERSDVGVWGRSRPLVRAGRAHDEQPREIDAGARRGGREQGARSFDPSAPRARARRAAARRRLPLGGRARGEGEGRGPREPTGRRELDHGPARDAAVGQQRVDPVEIERQRARAEGPLRRDLRPERDRIRRRQQRAEEGDRAHTEQITSSRPGATKKFAPPSSSAPSRRIAKGSPSRPASTSI